MYRSFSYACIPYDENIFRMSAVEHISICVERSLKRKVGSILCSLGLGQEKPEGVDDDGEEGESYEEGEGDEEEDADHSKGRRKRSRSPRRNQPVHAQLGSWWYRHPRGGDLFRSRKDPS